MDEDRPHDPRATVTMSDETAWRLFFNALPPSAAAAEIRIEGDAAFAARLLRVRSVVV
jgi:hypothetical protein